MNHFKIKIKLLLASLVTISSQYKPVIEKGFGLTQEERSLIGYFLCIQLRPGKLISKFKPPFNSLSVMKVDLVDFLESILRADLFNIITDEISRKLENDAYHTKDHFIFKIQTQGKKIKMATIFTSEEATNKDKSDSMEHISSPTEATDEEKLQDYLNSNFPQKNKKNQEIFFDEAISDLTIHQREYGLKKGGVFISCGIYFESENFIVRPGGKEQSSDQIDSQKIQFSYFEQQDSNAALDESFKNKKSILYLRCALGANYTVDGSEESEKTIRWKFQHPQDKGILSNAEKPFEMVFWYFVNKNTLERENRSWNLRIEMSRVLEWWNLQKFGLKNKKKVVEIMDTHFKDWNVDVEKELPLQKPKFPFKASIVLLFLLFVIIVAFFSIFCYFKTRKRIQKRKYVNK